MDRNEAIELVATTIAKYKGVTHLRFTTRGVCFGSGTRLRIMTLAPAGVKRPKGTQEQKEVWFADDWFAKGAQLTGLVPESAWFEAFAVLDPTIDIAGAGWGSTGFDVDAAGNITNRHGSKARAERREREYQRQLHERNVRTQAAARIQKVDPDTVTIYRSPRPREVDTLILSQLREKAARNPVIKLDLDAVLVDYLPLMTASRPEQQRLSPSDVLMRRFFKP